MSFVEERGLERRLLHWLKAVETRKFVTITREGTQFVTRDRTVLDVHDDLINGEYGNQDPFLRHDGLVETILDLNVQSCRTKDLADQAFELGAVDVVELITRDNLDIGHEVSGIEARLGDAAFDTAAGHAILRRISRLSAPVRTWRCLVMPDGPAPTLA